MFSIIYVLLAASVSAQYLVESSSFGFDGRVSSNNDRVPGWRLSGDGGQIPQILADKVILTPPYPGSQRGALWAESNVAQPDWEASFEFRATGPDRGGGNLNVWYASMGPTLGTSSIYTVNYFDGVVLVIDSYGGRGGSIRGFMNDGTLDYKNYHSVDSLAFGHCDYPYRNLGRLSKLQVKQESHRFEVKVDDKPCFQTDKIRMPSGYHFGITAASAEIADSFEAYKFTVSTASTTREEPGKAQAPQDQQPFTNIHSSPRDIPAAQIRNNDAQFEDLHNRLQSLAHSIENLFQEVKSLSEKSESRHNEVSRRGTVSVDRLSGLDQRLQTIERNIRENSDQFSSLHNIFRDSHSNLAESLPKHMSDLITTKSPRLGPLVFLLVGIQLLLAGSYVVYKRRRAQGPKKYL